MKVDVAFVKARLRTSERADELSNQYQAAMYKLLGGMTVTLRCLVWNNALCGTLYNWEPEGEADIVMAFYCAEHTHGFTGGKYNDNFEAFFQDWQAGTFSPCVTAVFAQEDIEILEVLSEPVAAGAKFLEKQTTGSE